MGSTPAYNGDGSKNEEPPAEGDVETIVDPDNFHLRRRLRQLHEAKETVREYKMRAISTRLDDKRVQDKQVNWPIAEAVIDYISELRPLLGRNGLFEDFQEETVLAQNDEEVTIAEFAEARGRWDKISAANGDEWVSYETSMRIWEKCNEYFERLAGTEFEKEGLPAEKGFQSVEEDDRDQNGDGE